MSKLIKVLLCSPESRRAWQRVPDALQADYVRRIQHNFDRDDLRDQELRQGAREVLCELIGVAT